MAAATWVFVLFEGPYGLTARLVTQQQPWPIHKLYKGHLFHVPSADDLVVAPLIQHRPGLARWNLYAEAAPVELADSRWLVGSRIESDDILRRDVNQVAQARRVAQGQRRSLLDLWAALVVTSHRPVLYVDNLSVYDEAMEALRPWLRGMNHFSQVLPVLGVHDRILRAATAIVPVPGLSAATIRLATMELGLSAEIRHFAVGLHHRDRLLASARPVMATPRPPLPLGTRASRIATIVAEYLGEPSLSTPEQATSVLIYETLAPFLQPLWRPAWRHRFPWQRDESVPAWLQRQEGRLWGLRFVPATLGLAPGSW